MVRDYGLERLAECEKAVLKKNIEFRMPNTENFAIFILQVISYKLSYVRKFRYQQAPQGL